MPSEQLSNEFNLDYLRVYYKKLFPFSDFHKWLAYGNAGNHPGRDPSYFAKREFSFTLQGDIFVRYQSFKDASELELAVCEKCPNKIDIGAVYNVDLSKRAAYSNSSSDKVFSPVEKELVFDVDMTDYDDIRTCCSGADICLRCWPLMTIAIKVVDTALREDFGFEHILWVYSGRRGVHCWVCDARARRLSNEQRGAIAEYFRVYKGNENNSKKVSLFGPFHPFLRRSYDAVLARHFEQDILPNQSVLLPEANFDKVLTMISTESSATPAVVDQLRTIVDQLRTKWSDSKRSSHAAKDEDINKDRWQELCSKVDKKHKRSLEEIVITYTYPRLDLEVSKHMNHLLKAPFCVHPKTGRVCVPIDPAECDSFNPTTVPTLSQLLNELNQEEGGAGWERTSLAEPLRFFKTSFLEPLLKECKTLLIEKHHKEREEKHAMPNFSW